MKTLFDNMTVTPTYFVQHSGENDGKSIAIIGAGNLGRYFLALLLRDIKENKIANHFINKIFFIVKDPKKWKL